MRTGPAAWLAAVRREPWLAGLVAFMSAVIGAASLIRYDNFGATTDLALFDQAVWHYSRFEAPFSTIKGFDLLGDHFHPTVALLAPLYWIWSDPRMLLIAGAVLVALSTIPVFLFARRRLERRAAYLLAVAYATFFGLQIGATTDFHELELAPLLIALAILLADEERWGRFWLVIALMLGVKEDLAPFAALFGVYMLTRRDARRGIALIVIGVAWYELATRVAIPHLSPEHYTYWSYSELGPNIPSAVWALVKAPWRLVTITLSPATKDKTLLYLLAPFLFLSLRSPRFILALPLLAERFLSTNGQYWTPYFHYNLAIAPVLATSAAAGAAALVPWLQSDRHPQRLIRGLPASPAVAVTGAMALLSVAVSFWLTPSPFRQLLRPGFYRAPAFAAAASRAIAQIPPGAPVSANDALLPRLSHRDHADEIAAGRPVKSYVIADLGEPVGLPIGNASFAAFGHVLNGYLQQTTPVYYSGGWLVAKLPPRGQRPGNGVIAPLAPGFARRIRSLAFAWEVQFDGSLASSLACNRRAAACAPQISARLAQYAAALQTGLARSAESAHGPCKTLEPQTADAVAELTGGLLALRAASFHADLARLKADVDDRDLRGRLDRYLVLCYPRGRSLLASSAA